MFAGTSGSTPTRRVSLLPVAVQSPSHHICLFSFSSLLRTYMLWPSRQFDESERLPKGGMREGEEADGTIGAVQPATRQYSSQPEESRSRPSESGARGLGSARPAGNGLFGYVCGYFSLPQPVREMLRGSSACRHLRLLATDSRAPQATTSNRCRRSASTWNPQPQVPRRRGHGAPRGGSAAT